MVEMRFTQDELLTIASSLTLTIMSAKAYEENGTVLDPETKKSIYDSMVLLEKIDRGLENE